MPWKTIIKKGYVINNELEILDIIPFSEIPIYVKEIRRPKTISRKLEDISFCKLKCLRCKRISYLKDESANRMASMFLRRKEGCSLTQQAQTTC